MISFDFRIYNFYTVKFIVVLLLFAFGFDFLIIADLKLPLSLTCLFRVYTVILATGIPVSQKSSRYVLTVCSGFILKLQWGTECEWQRVCHEAGKVIFLAQSGTRPCTEDPAHYCRFIRELSKDFKQEHS